MRFESDHIAVLVLTNVPRVYQSMSRVNQFTIDGVSFYYRDRIVAVEANALLPMTRDSGPDRDLTASVGITGLRHFL